MKKPGFHTCSIKLTVLPELDRWLNIYTVIFHCVPYSEIMSLVFMAAHLKPCVSFKWCLAPLADHGSLALVLRGLGKP